MILTRDVTEHRLRAGDVGTVVERHDVAGVPEEGCSVEFFDLTGNTVAVVTLPASALRLLTPADRPGRSAPELSDGSGCLPEGIDGAQPRGRVVPTHENAAHQFSSTTIGRLWL